MNESSSQTIPTLLSLWSAMLGGAVGGAVGKLSGNVLYTATLGFLVGGVVSVFVHMVLFLPVYAAALYVSRAEFGEYAVGDYKGDALAAIMGGAAGLCGAVVVTLALPSASLNEPRAFAVCWTVVTLVPLALTLALVRRTRRTRG